MTTTIAQRQLGTQIIEALAPLMAQHRNKWAARCHEHGLSLIGFQVLALLEMHGEIPMSRLAEELDVALPNATGIVARMVERGIIQRLPDEHDRRVVRVSLTDAGHDLINEMEAGRRERMTRLIGLLDSTQQLRLLQSVKDLHGAALRLASDTKPGETEPQ